jgi:hypothetical protein
MATKTVNEIPDIKDLLIDAFDENADVKTISSAAHNALAPLVAGVEAIGYMIWHVASSEHEMGIESDQLASIGWLLQTLSRQATYLQNIESYADDILLMRALEEKKGIATTAVKAQPEKRKAAKRANA